MGMSGAAAGAVRAVEAGEEATAGIRAAKALGTAGAVGAIAAGGVAAARATGLGENPPSEADVERAARSQSEAENRQWLAQLAAKERRGEKLDPGEEFTRRWLSSHLSNP